MRRGKIPSKKSKKLFTRGAQRVHKTNSRPVMRGGMRL